MMITQQELDILIAMMQRTPLSAAEAYAVSIIVRKLQAAIEPPEVNE